MYIPLTFEGALQKCLFASSSTTEGFFVSGSQQWKFHWFTGSGQFVVDKGSIDNARIYVIGGGGGGATGQFNSIGAGGGGGGGVTYSTSSILYRGTYTITIGRGGTAGSGSQSNGSSGVASSFVGQNINLSAAGGGGGTWGADTTGGTSGNGFGGGLSSFSNGGGGGGAFGTGSNATSTKAGNGGIGLSLQVSEPFNNPTNTWGFGCGGGGYNAISTNQPGFSCNETNYGNGGDGNSNGGDGANYYGMGGGAGSTLGGKGGSGSVIIQYPITDYCGNYFNETGSCGCREITFDTSDPFDFYPDYTGSYIYMPCGGNQFVSGSLFPYAPITVCAVSNSYFAYTSNYIFQGDIKQGFVTTGSQCLSASLAPVACSPEAFPATCASQIVTIYTPSASVSNPTDFGYVAKNETTSSIYNTTQNRVKYICISTGSVFNGLYRYPQVLTGNFATLYNTASCNTITITGGGRGIITNCNGAEQTLINPTIGSTYCIDRTVPIRGISGFFLFTYTVGGSCLSGSFDTSSCGCP